MRPVPVSARVAGILLLALGLRLYAVRAASVEPSADAADYSRLAEALVDGRGYINPQGGPTAFRAPGYAAFLAVTYWVVGKDHVAAGYVQAMVGVVTVVLMMLLARMLLGPGEALLSGLIAAIYPVFFWMPRLLLSENLAMPFVLGTLCLAILILRRQRHIPALAVALGVVCALGVYVRTINLPIAALLLGCMAVVMWRRGRRRDSLLVPIVAGGLMAISLVPWMLRNQGAFGQAVFTTQNGISLYGAYWPPYTGSRPNWNLPGDEDPDVAAVHRQNLNEAESSAAFSRLTKEKLRRQPRVFFALIPAKLLSLAAPLDWDFLPRAAGQTRSINFGYVIVVAFGLFGAYLVYRNPPADAWLLAFLPVCVLIQAVFFFGSPRYRLPAESTAVLLACHAVMHLRRKSATV